MTSFQVYERIHNLPFFFVIVVFPCYYTSLQQDIILNLCTEFSSGSRPRPVGKRTPRFPVSFSYENNNKEKYLAPTRQGLKLKANADDDEVAHEIAMALAEASQRGSSPQVSGTPNKRAESVMSSPFRNFQRKVMT